MCVAVPLLIHLILDLLQVSLHQLSPDRYVLNSPLSGEGSSVC